jgi:UDP-N-acetylglucosamine--N-acetylmuramyl-(pentapeptide) pyrophosphoryl-undecaprenol N-acetylglucosamine transferase
MAQQEPRPSLHVLLAGGGSGGHVFPALRVAEELLRRGHQVSYTGSAKGLEARLVAERQLPFYPLAARPLVGQSLVGKAWAVATLAASAWAGRRLIRRLGVDAVFGTGGYASAPAVVAGRWTSRPVVLLEPNARSGVANRWLSRWSTVAAVAYEETADQLACPSFVSGVPVREGFFQVRPGRLEDHRCRLLVLGGSQGALQLNLAVPLALRRVREALGAETQMEVVHQCGARHEVRTRSAYREALEGAAQESAPQVEIVPFLEDVPQAMANSDLVISRAGALTLAEISAAGRPSILVPLAGAHGHQRDNARALQGAGAAEVMSGTELETTEGTAGLLAAHLCALLGSPEQLLAMGQAARRVARCDAAERIVDRLESLVATPEGRS